MRAIMPWAPKMLKRTLPPAVEIRGTSCQRGYDYRWQKLRHAKLSRDPFCERCEGQGVTTQATLVDHITPIVDGGARLDDHNLQSLCVPCHAIKTANDLAKRKA
jgi:5-methylcytosine-specific restriction protein A